MNGISISSCLAILLLLSSGCSPVSQQPPQKAGRAISPWQQDAIRATVWKVCVEKWGLNQDQLSLVNITPDGNEFIAKYEDSKYEYIMRCDSAGKWINDGRMEK